MGLMDARIADDFLDQMRIALSNAEKAVGRRLSADEIRNIGRGKLIGSPGIDQIVQGEVDALVRKANNLEIASMPDRYRP